MASAVGKTCVVWVSTANYNEKKKRNLKVGTFRELNIIHRRKSLGLNAALCEASVTGLRNCSDGDINWGLALCFSFPLV